MTDYIRNMHAGWKRYLVAKEMLKSLLEHDTRNLMANASLIDSFYKQELIKIYKELTRYPKKVKKTGKKFLTSKKKCDKV